MNDSVQQPGARLSEGRLWPLWGPAAVILVMSRVLVTTPSLTTQQQAAVPGSIVETLAVRQFDLYFGNGVSWLGTACLVVFVAGLHRRLRSVEPTGSLMPTVALMGGTATAAGLFLGYGFLALMAGVAGEGRAATTVAAIYSIGDSLAYMAWTWIGVTTAAVAVAGIRRGSVPRWLGYVSAVFTAIFGATAFFPFIGWLPALVWLLVASIGLLASRQPDAPGYRAVSLAASESAP